MPNHSQQLDRMFQALADPTRRAVLEALARGPQAMSELARPFGMALPSFAQHLGVLEDCGLVRSRKEGRVRTFQLATQPFAPAEKWMQRQRKLWETRMDQFDSYVLNLKREEERKK